MLKIRLLKIISIVTVVSILISSLYVYADEESDLEQQQETVNSQISSTKNQIENVKSQMSTNMKQIDNLNSQIDSFTDEIYSLEEKLEQLNNEIDTKKKDIEVKKQTYAENEELLKQRLVATYKTGKVRYLDVLLNSQSLSDFLSKYFLLEKLTDHDSKLLAQIKQEKEQLEQEQASLEESQKEVQAEADKLKARKEALEVTINEKNVIMKNLNSEEASLQSELEDLRETDANIKARLKQVREAKIPASVVAAGESYEGKISSYGLSYPVKNAAIGTQYGVSGRYWSLGYHTGLDFRASTGTPVYASGTGIVVEAGSSRAYGKHIILYHPDSKLFTLYAHGSSLLVSYGETVSRGEQIMVSGATGNVTGPHLHFEVRTGNGSFSNCVNPANYLP